MDSVLGSIGRRIEAIASRRIAVRVVVLLVAALLLGGWSFGAIVRERALGRDQFGRMGNLAYGLAALPSEAARAFRMMMQDDLAGMATEHSDRFPGKQGWTFFDVRLESGLDGYLLFSRHDGDVGHHVFELVDLKAGETVHRIDVDPERLFAGASSSSGRSVSSWLNPRRFQAVHPVPLDNGDLLVKAQESPMVRMTPCGDPVWILDDEFYHHTTEPGPDGNFWTSGFVRPQEVRGLAPTFYDPSIVEFSAEGKVLYHRSVTKVMLDQGLGFLILGAHKFYGDPLHLNDVQPVFEDGPYWKRGDIFVSLRHPSTIMLIRPSTDKILWWKSGPWVSQHDVDVIDSTTIAVFNNNALNFGDGEFVNGRSDIIYYDFATDTVSSPYAKVLAANDFRNEAGGLFTVLPDGHYYVDESESGRTLIFTPKGELAVEHINRAKKNGLIYHLGWSRYLTRAEGDRLKTRWKAAKCN